MDYPTFRDLVVAFVSVEGRRFGWRVRRVKRATTGSAYVELERQAGGGAVERCCVRVSDHRPGRRSLGARLLSVRQAAAGRLHQLADFLASGRLRQPGVAAPAALPPADSTPLP